MLKLNWTAIGQDLWAHKKIIGIIVGLLILLAAMTWMFTSVDEWLFGRSVRKDKEEIKEKTNELREIDKEIANLQGQRQVTKEELNQAIGNYANAVNATDQAREITNQAQANTNAALANLANVANANLGNVNATDIDKLLEQLP